MSAGAVLESPSAVPSGDVLYEVVNGQRRELPPMGAFENSLAKILLVALDTFGFAKSLGEAYGEMLFLLDSATNLQRRPDVAFVSYQRWPKGKLVPRTPAWEVVPDLAVEVISASNTWDEIMEKLQDYFRVGVLRVWVVSPTVAQVYVYSTPGTNVILNRNDPLDGENVVPGFSLPLSQLFLVGVP
jgi:Uma2 family endonuclease